MRSSRHNRRPRPPQVRLPQNGAVRPGGRGGVADRSVPAGRDGVRTEVRVAAGYAWRLLVVAVAVYLVFVVLGRLHFVAVALFVGLLITALLRPLTDLLARRMPRGPAVALALIQAFVVTGGAIAFVATSAVGQFSGLVGQFREGVRDIEEFLAGPPLRLEAVQLSRLVAELQTWISENQGTLAGRAVGSAGVAVELFTGLALAVFCSIFFLHSGDRMWSWFLDQVPGDRGRWDVAATAAWTTLAGYTRGIVIVATTNAALVLLVLLVLRVPLALPLALLVLVASFVPLIGAPVALAVATLVALAGRGPLIAVAVLVLIVVIGQIEGHVLHPIVMSRAVNLHPVAVAVAVASGTVLAGIIGAVVAVPFVAVGWATYTALRRDPKDRSRHRTGRPVPGT